MSDRLLRVGILGVGRMGADHAERIATRINGARLVAVSDPATERAGELAATFAGVRAVDDALELIADDEVDAVVVASPGFAHEEQVLACLEAAKPVLCEKPLTMDSASSLRLVEMEAKGARPLVQVGFMRRFDPEYAELKRLLDSGSLGRTLMVHNMHRNKDTLPGFVSEMIVRDSLVHEVDVTRWLFGEEIAQINVMAPTPTSVAAEGVLDPQIAIFTMAGGGIVDQRGVRQLRHRLRGPLRGRRRTRQRHDRSRLGSRCCAKTTQPAPASRRTSATGSRPPTTWRSRPGSTRPVVARSSDPPPGTATPRPSSARGHRVPHHRPAGERRARAPPRFRRLTLATEGTIMSTHPHHPPRRRRRWTGAAERTSQVFNPATGEVTGALDLASADLVGEVVATAPRRLAGVGGHLAGQRTQGAVRVPRAARPERRRRSPRSSPPSTARSSTTPLGEVTRGLEVAEFACGIPHLLKGGFSENASTSVDVYSMRQPLGVVAVISPFNFPAMVPMWFIPIAIACGNAVVLKPSEKDPSAALAVARLWKEAGLPDGVMNVVNGDKEAVDALLTHPDIKSVSFVGSTPIAKYVYETGTAHGKRVQALGGAKNHMLVLPDADLDLAADAAVNAGFGSAGERCMAISALIAVEPIADELVSKIHDRMGKLRTGDGTRGCDMGPLVTSQHRDKVAVATSTSGSRTARPSSSTVATPTSTPTARGSSSPRRCSTTSSRGCRSTTTRSSARSSRSSGCTRTRTALNLINSNPYGNGTAIFTNDGGAARRFQHEIEVGMVGVNVPIPVPVSYFSFGGWKNSLFGDTHAHGIEGVHFFTRGKVVTSRWLDPSHGGLNLGFPQNA